MVSVVSWSCNVVCVGGSLAKHFLIHVVHLEAISQEVEGEQLFCNVTLRHCHVTKLSLQNQNKTTQKYRKARDFIIFTLLEQDK